MHSIECYRLAIGIFYLKLRHRIHKIKKIISHNDGNCLQSFHSCVLNLTRHLICITLFYILQLNLHYGIVITTKLIKDGVESNPGPETSGRNYAIQKTIHGTHHQGSLKYGEYAERQCTANAYFAIIYSAIKNIGIWKPFDIDYILQQGNRIFRDVCVATGVIQPLAVDQLPPNIYMEGIYISINSLSHESHLFLEKNNLFENYRHYSPSEKGNGVIFTCAGFSVAVLWTQDYFYVFDSHSRNSKGFHDPNGKAILLKFCSITSVNNYLKVFYSSIVSLDTQYDLQYVSIDIDRNSINEIKVKLQRKRKLQYNNSYNSKEEAKKRKIEQQKEYYDKNKDKIIDSKKQYNKNVRAIRRQQKFYYGDTVNKNYSSLKSSEAILDYVSEADPIAVIFEKNSACFSDIDFCRERSKAIMKIIASIKRSAKKVLQN